MNPSQLLCKLCKLCKIDSVHSVHSAENCGFWALSAQLCKLCTGKAVHSTQKMADFCAMQLCKLCTPYGGKERCAQRALTPAGRAAR